MLRSGWWESSPLWFPSWQPTVVLLSRTVLSRNQTQKTNDRRHETVQGLALEEGEIFLRWWRFPLHHVPSGSFVLSVFISASSSASLVHSHFSSIFSLCWFLALRWKERIEMHFDIPTHTSTVKCCYVFGAELLLMCAPPHWSILLCTECHSQWQLSSSVCLSESMSAIIDTFAVWKLASSNTTTNIDSSLNRRTIEALLPA